MNYYCLIIAYNSKNEILLFRPKTQTKNIVCKIAEDLKISYKLVVICHNEIKAKSLLKALKHSEFPNNVGKIISIV